MILFECQKCGTCCHDLIEDADGITQGLMLTYQETRLFPSELISPKTSLGKRRPRKTLIHQLDARVCPHLDGRNMCRIYHKRPLVCQAFPSMVLARGATVSLKCPIVAGMAEDERREIILSTTEVEAGERLYRYFLSRFLRFRAVDSSLWEFDLKRKEWVKTRMPMP